MNTPNFTSKKAILLECFLLREKRRRMLNVSSAEQQTGLPAVRALDANV